MFYGIPEARRQKFDEALNFILDTYGGEALAADMIIALKRNLSFLTDRKFTTAFQTTATNDQEMSLVWRLHVLTWAAAEALRLEGDFAECGVFMGFSTAVICKYLDFATVPRTFFLYDTFAGLPEETSSTEERVRYANYARMNSREWLDEVRKRFSPYPNVRIVPGVVPQSFAGACPESIALLHLDMNSAKAELLALEHLFDRIVTGGMIVLDDFGWAMHRGQMVSQLAFFHERGHRVLELPTGQGLVIRH